MSDDARTAAETAEETGPQFTLLDQLDARQNDVLAQLDALNLRIEVLLQEFTRQTPVEEALEADKAA